MTQAILTAHNFLTQGVEGFIDLLKSINQKLITRRAIRATEKELGKLSDLELNDIGLSRGDIHWVARSEKTIAEANNNLRGWV